MLDCCVDGVRFKICTSNATNPHKFENFFEGESSGYFEMSVEI